MLVFALPFFSSAQNRGLYTVAGRVTALTDGQALVGASVIIKGTATGSVTDRNGKFELEVPEGATVLTISFIGFVSQDITIRPPLAEPLIISLEEDIFALGEVQVVSTGYQEIPKERATGSFVHVGNDLIDRSVSTSILDRLGGVTPGLLLNPEGGREGGDPVSIRGYSTIMADPDPLIVVDNFPYDGDIESINPNDVESITVLKDAAAASIWGARAGNGVIVITTKQGKPGRGEGPLVSFNSNLTVGEKPDAFYVPRMSVADYIATEKALFGEGYYSYDETAYDHRAISPLIELLIAERDGELTAEETAARIADLSQHDVRKDFNKYFYREKVNQQYAVNISGGDQQQRYFLSAGYDRNLGELVGDSFQRITLHAKNTWNFFDKKLWFSGNLYYSQSSRQNNGIDPSGIRMSDYNVLPPFLRLVGEDGQPLSIVQDYRTSFVETAEANGFLDWRYRPLEELALNDKTSHLTDYRMNFGTGYKILPGLEATIRYQYWQSLFSDLDYYPEESYYARDLINSFTQVEDGTLVRPIPIGGILDRRGGKSYSHNLRTQLGYTRSWRNKHEVSAIAGYEIKGKVTKGNSNRYYGYDGDFPISVPVDYAKNYNIYHNPYSLLRVPANEGHIHLIDRFISYYANASYTYGRRFTLSASARKDKSNLFGVEANQRGVPLWSAGVGWTISNEDFYHWKWMPFIKLRATYGYNGNIDKSVTAYTTAQVIGNSYSTGLLYGQITNPANPDLRWERVAMQNIGLDFASKNDRLKGTLEFYGKQGYDLIGFAPLPPSVGQEEFRGNTAETKGHGIDFSLSTLNVDNSFQWRTDWLFSRADIRVSDYLREESRTYFLLDQGHFGGSPQVGKPLHVIYSYAWAGLDPQTGNPRGYVDGEASQEYADIIDRATVDSLVYHGSARPTTFGAIRNTFSWKNFSLSVNISYRMNYYFRRESIDYYYDRGLGGHGDYAMRWKKPGDEAFTEIPSIPESPNINRDNFYEYSEVLVERGDHIRLQDINLTYTLERKNNPSLPFRSIQIYGYARHLGILWKKTGKVKDPDFRSRRAPRSYSLGLRVNF